MCGLVGMAGKLEYKDEKTMKRLLHLDYFRGPDSTGLAALRKNGDVKLAKVASHPFDLFDMKRFTEALSGWNSLAFIGHNRLATKGVVNSVNAHPYEYDHIVGAHNGTLDASSWKDLEKAIGEETNVDSQALYLAIAKLGIEETVKLLRGAWALTWIDTNEGTLNFLRNKERPLWYCYNETFDKLFWASEYWMMQTAAAQADPAYKLYTEDKTFHRFWQFEENWWYRIPLEELAKGHKERPKFRVKELKGKEPVSGAAYACGYTPFRHGGAKTTTSTTTSHSSTSKGSKEQKVVQLMGSAALPFGSYVSKERFDEIAKYGCSWCQADVEYEQPGVTVYASQDMILCPSCSRGEGDTTRVYTKAL